MSLIPHILAHLFPSAPRHIRQQMREGVGTGAGEGASGQDTGSAWVTRSMDCPEAPAQAHPLHPSQLPEVTVFRAVDIPDDMLDELRAIPLCDWQAAIQARHEAEKLTDAALAEWVNR